MRGAGEPVVLVHAFSVDRRMWEPQVAVLEKRFRVIRYDLRGHGQSAAANEPFRAYDDLRDVLDTLKIERATIVGLSAGSEVAINFALDVSGARDTSGPCGARRDRIQDAAAAMVRPIGEALAKGDIETAAKRWAEDADHGAAHQQGCGRDSNGDGVDNAKIWSMKRLEQPLAPPAIDRLAEIKAPTFVIVGDQDLPHIREVAG